MLNRDSPKKKKENNSTSRHFRFSPFSIPTMPDDGEDLESICSNNGVPAHIFSGMMTAGWTITLATGFKDASEFDDESALQDLGITESLTRLEKAALKVVWTQCSKIFKDSQSSGSSQSEQTQHHHLRLPRLAPRKVGGMKHSHQSWVIQQ